MSRVRIVLALLAVLPAAFGGGPAIGGEPAEPAAPPVRVELSFPTYRSQAAKFEGSILRPGLLGATSPFVKSWPLDGRIRVTNPGAAPFGPLRFELVAEEPLVLVVEKPEPEPPPPTATPAATATPPPWAARLEASSSARAAWRLPPLAPGATGEFFFQVEPPRPDRPGSVATGLDWRLTLAPDATPAPPPLAAGTYPVTVENPRAFLGPLLLFLLSAAALALLVWATRRSGILTRLSNVDLATLGVLAAFLVVGTFLVPLLRALGVPTVGLVAAGQLPVWLGVLCAARLVRKPGAVALLLFTYQIVQDLLFYGLSPLLLATETLPAALALELYLALTGYARRLPAALGAAPVYLLATEGLLYGVTQPLFYHAYYAAWYVELTMLTHGAIYLVWAGLGHRLAVSLERTLR